MAQDFNDPEELAWEQPLVRRAQAGDRAAFAELYRRFSRPLYSRVLLPRLGQASAAEDALAETFRIGLERLDTYEPRGSSLFFWLARIATNQALDLHRARGATGRALVNVRTLLLPTQEGPKAADEALTEFEDLERNRLHAARCLEAIHPRYRRAIELRFFEGHDRQECARLLEVKLGTFDVLLLRALRSFRAQWEASSEELSA